MTPARVLVPFSGQQDAVDLALHSAAAHPESEVVLLFVQNIGFRASFEPPLETARALAARCPAVRRLVVTDARRIQTGTLAALPHDLAQALGLRSICAACQSSLLFVSVLICRRLDASLAFGAREALGPDLDGALRTLAGRLGQPGEIEPVPPSAVRLPMLASQRCALAAHHAGATPLDAAGSAELVGWMDAVATALLARGADDLALDIHALDVGGA
jgi:hypothetical protein